MSSDDEKHTSFMTDQGTYCYNVIPFNLKNANVTYQWLVNKMFETHISRNVEVYIYDIYVKSKVANDYVCDLAETFKVLRVYRMKINPANYMLRVTSRKSLGFIVSQRSIEANPEKIKVIFDMNPPRTVKEVHKLKGRLAALLRFLAQVPREISTVLQGPRRDEGDWILMDECV